MNRICVGRSFAIFLCLLVNANSVARAQPVVDGTTNTLSNITNSFPGDVTVGNSNSFSLLVISNNALLGTALNGVIGLNATAKSNDVQLVSSSARWQVGNNLYVGSNGAVSRLVVSNGAYVEDFSGTLAFRAASSNNFALVTGSGSLWTNRSDLRIGNLGAGNQLVVSNGGFVASKFGYIGGSSSSSNNSALISGSGSTWSNQFDLYVGFLNGASNRLVIEAGGLVVSDNGLVGESGGSSNNVALVTGTGSVWSNRTGLFVGNSGTVNNRLTVSNAAVVWSGNGASGAGGRSNHVLVTGSGSVWTNQALWSVGGSGNSVDVNNGGGLANADGTLGGGFGSTNNTFTLSGSGSTWNNSGVLKVGDGGDANTFIASNGATVLSSNALIGASTSLGNNNFALLTGTGTLWSNRNDFTVGNFSAGNQLLVSNTAMLTVGSNLVVGANSGSGSNRVVVDGGTLRVTNAAGTAVLDVRRGTNVLNAGLIEVDQLTITNRGFSIPIEHGNGTSNTIPASSSPATIYPSTIAVAGRLGSVVKVTVTLTNLNYPGANSLDILLVGPAGQKVMLMSDAGLAATVNATLTFDDSAASALPQSSSIVAGTFLPTDYELGDFMPFPAPAGPYSTSLASFNGTDPNGTWSLYIAVDSSGPFGGGLRGWSVQIVTDGGPFRDPGALDFKGGTLITRGAVINNDLPFVVGGPGGVPAVWGVRAGMANHYLASDLIVGSNSSFNQLLITNGAVLTNFGNCYVGYDTGANSNAVVISGTGSQWRSPETFDANLFYSSVGYGGSFNRLVVSNGGWLSDYVGAVGTDFFSSNNTAIVTGPGSVWSNAANLYVGGSGRNNQLTISNGAVVVAAFGVYEGSSGTSKNSRLVVDGGALRSTNDVNVGLKVDEGTAVLNAGLVDVSGLVLIDTHGQFEFNGGTLKPRTTLCDNGRIFTVGDGTRLAVLQLPGGTHSYSNGLLIINNATLTGYGTIAGALTVASGTLAPGDGIGTLIVTGLANLQGATVMEAFKLGGSRFNDLVQVSNIVVYGGSLTVSNVGLAAFAVGDNFKLFNATAYSGSFTSLNLPPLNAGLGWTNKLLVDGSIEVIAVSISQPKFSNISVSGTNVILSGTNGTANASFTVLAATNVATPLSNWVSIATNQFDSNGNFSFTNAISLAEPEHYFRLRTP